MPVAAGDQVVEGAEREPRRRLAPLHLLVRALDEHGREPGRDAVAGGVGDEEAQRDRIEVAVHGRQCRPQPFRIGTLPVPKYRLSRAPEWLELRS